MDRGEPGVLDALRLGIEPFLGERAAHALLELLGRLRGEGDCEHLVDAIEERLGHVWVRPLLARLGPGRERVQHALGEHEGLAGSCARGDEDRAGKRMDDACLLGVEGDAGH